MTYLFAEFILFTTQHRGKLMDAFNIGPFTNSYMVVAMYPVNDDTSSRTSQTLTQTQKYLFDI